MNKFKELQNKHLVLLEKFKEGQSSGELIQEVETYIEEVKIAGKDIPSSQQRDQLRANLRFWGAFIYERKKVFPDTNLWPSTKKNPPDAWRHGKRIPLTLGILGSIILVLIIILAVFRTPMLTTIPKDDPKVQLQTDEAATSLVKLTQNALEYQALSPSPTNLSILTPVIAERTATPPAMATIASGFIQLATATQPIINTSTAIPEPRGFIPISKYASGCEDKKRDIRIIWSVPNPDASLVQSATAYLSRPGTDVPEKQVGVLSNGDAAVISPSDSGTSKSYFLQIMHPQFLFEPIIVQFTSDCAYDRLSITYSDNNDRVAQSIQDINLALVDWGPNSHSNSSSWIAELSIKQDVGGIYMYNGSPIKEETIFVDGSGCSSKKPFTIGRASNGKFQEATFSLYMAGPLCPQSGTD